MQSAWQLHTVATEAIRRARRALALTLQSSGADPAEVVCSQCRSWASKTLDITRYDRILKGWQIIDPFCVQTHEVLVLSKLCVFFLALGWDGCCEALLRHNRYRVHRVITVVTLIFVVLSINSKIARQYLRAILETNIHSRQTIKSIITCIYSRLQSETGFTATRDAELTACLLLEGLGFSRAPLHACNVAKTLVLWQCQACRQALKVD